VARRRHPWWIPPFLGRVPPELDDGTLRLLGAVALALLFEEYDNSILTSALKHIAPDLRVAEHELPLYLALIRSGALPAFVLIPFADRIGRRPVFIGSLIAMGLVTFATALAATPLQFVLLQALARTSFIACSAVAFVIVTEELPAAHRGWGIGMLAALGAVGNGLGATVFSQIDRLPFGWRALYALGLLPVLLLPFFLKRVAETRRFVDHSAEHVGRGEGSRWLGSVTQLFAERPLRALGVAAAGFLASIATFPSAQFTGYFTQVKLGWAPQQYTWMVIAGGAVGIIGNIVAGRLGDGIGRRGVGCALFACVPFASFGFYRGGSGTTVVVSWIAMVFCSMGGRVMLRALATELFPTSQRGAASGMLSVLDTLGAVTGLLVIYVHDSRDVNELATVIPIVSSVIWLAALALLSLPETRRRELEDIA
jgi:MFS transporter, putative metabolite:H+ symporter